MIRSEGEKIVLEFVRGERPWTDLAEAGMTITVDDKTYSIENPCHIEARASAEDIAAGLLAYRSRPDFLREWARMVMAGSLFVEFAFEDDHPAADILLGALWDASFGVPVSELAWNTAEELLHDEVGEGRRERAS